MGDKIKRYDRIITCHKRHLEQRCMERGYKLEEVMPCVIKQKGDQWTIDTHHSAYPMVMTEQAAKIHEKLKRAMIAGPPDGGAGTELKGLLKKIGIVASPNCSCNKRANMMDAKGIDWCKENIEEIVDWLAEEAQKRKLPFLRFAGKKLVQLAISRAERKNGVK